MMKSCGCWPSLIGFPKLFLPVGRAKDSSGWLRLPAQAQHGAGVSWPADLALYHGHKPVRKNLVVTARAGLLQRVLECRAMA